MKKILTLIATLLIVSSCTENERSRRFGGTQEIKLEENEKFINITWKENSLWVITQDTITGIVYAREKSSYGIMEGKIIITE